ncbi:MAG: class I SAM-dependent methyltransferase [Acidobacteria bacterium]|nr:class I SAM-dependent methyltransferase [Acidobacteriota bacterium]
MLYVTEYARPQAGHRATFLCEEVGSDTFLGFSSFDIVLAHCLVHHLNDDVTTGFFQLARSVLKSGGRLVTADGCYLEGQSPIARYLLSIDRGNFVGTRDQ